MQPAAKLAVLPEHHGAHAARCLQRPLHAAELGSLWQLALQHVALGFYAAAGREGERREQRDAFWARFKNWESGGGWSHAVPPP